MVELSMIFPLMLIVILVMTFIFIMVAICIYYDIALSMKVLEGDGSIYLVERYIKIPFKLETKIELEQEVVKCDVSKKCYKDNNLYVWE